MIYDKRALKITPENLLKNMINDNMIEIKKLQCKIKDKEACNKELIEELENRNQDSLF